MPSNFADRYRKFMSSRNGADALSRALLILAFVLLVVTFFTGSGAVRTTLITLILVLIALGYFRVFSSNISARQAENRRYQQAIGTLTNKIKPLKKTGDAYARKVKQAGRNVTDREHRYFTCPKCGASVRVPKGVGKIRVTCPVCGEKFERKA